MILTVPQVIITPRLRLRRCRADDAEAFVAFMSDTEATEHLLFTAEQKAPDAARAMLDAVVAGYDTDDAMFVLAVTRPGDDAYIGSCGLSPMENGSIECYYTVIRSQWGKGYGTEAARAVACHAIDTLSVDRLVANISNANPASRRVAEKIGMTDAGPIEGGRRFELDAGRFGIVRSEREGDGAKVAAVVEAAFPTEAEARLVERLRDSNRMPLSFVAERDSNIVGHIAFSPVTVDGEPCHALGLAPVAVHPDHQRKGIGGRLITRGLDACRAAGCAFVVVLGEPAYYERLGFETASKFGLSNVYGVDEPFMVLPMGDVRPGLVRYGRAFDGL